jgi:hypothetical protein
VREWILLDGEADPENETADAGGRAGKALNKAARPAKGSMTRIGIRECC